MSNPPRLFFAHANGFAPGAYEPLLTPLMHRYKVEAPALLPLRHGRPPSGPWGEIAEDLAPLVDADATPTVGVGHSLGAVALLMLAATRPTRFSRLVLIEPPTIPAWLAAVLGHAPAAVRRKSPMAEATRRRAAAPTPGRASSRPSHRPAHAPGMRGSTMRRFAWCCKTAFNTTASNGARASARNGRPRSTSGRRASGRCWLGATCRRSRCCAARNRPSFPPLPSTGGAACAPTTRPSKFHPPAICSRWKRRRASHRCFDLGQPARRLQEETQTPSENPHDPNATPYSRGSRTPSKPGQKSGADLERLPRELSKRYNPAIAINLSRRSVKLPVPERRNP